MRKGEDSREADKKWPNHGTKIYANVPPNLAKRKKLAKPQNVTSHKCSIAHSIRCQRKWDVTNLCMRMQNFAGKEHTKTINIKRAKINNIKMLIVSAPASNDDAYKFAFLSRCERSAHSLPLECVRSGCLCCFDWKRMIRRLAKSNLKWMNEGMVIGERSTVSHKYRTINCIDYMCLNSWLQTGTERSCCAMCSARTHMQIERERK